MPNTAQSITAGWPCSTASTSAGATWKPFTLIISLDRSVRWTQPSGSRHPTSPVRYQPSTMASAVASSGQVPGHERRAAGLDLTDLARRQDGTGVEVDHPELDLVGG